MRERSSRYLMAFKNDSRSPVTFTNNLLAFKASKPLLDIKSITLDNDIAFRHHEKFATELNVQTYFCDPFKSYQKGGIENANRMLRSYCPRKLDIDSLSQADLEKYVKLLNQRPLKCLNYQTPEEVYWKELKAAKGWI